MRRVIAFDLDGTLVDSAPAIREIAAAMLSELGAAPLELSETRRFIGEGAARFVARALAARGLPTEGPGFEAALARFEGLYAAAPGAANQPFPGAEAALRAVAEAGAAPALCTNKPRAPTLNLLDALGWRDLFAAVVAGDDLPERKPDAAPLRAAFAAAGGAGALYVGDSEIDEATAGAAGAPFALFTPGYRKKPVEAFDALFAFDCWESAAPRLRALATGA